MTTFRDDGGKLPAGLNRVTNNTERAERIDPLAEIAKIFKPVFHDTMNIMHAFDNDHRYWIDHKHQPHRITGKRPLLHNGKAPR